MSSLEDALLRIDAVSENTEKKGIDISERTVLELIKHAHVEFIKEQRPISMPDFTEPRFNTPMVVYTIQNTQNRKVYIGKTSKSFCERYPKGFWWEKTHNKDLLYDLQKYGYANFNVNVYFCDDKEQMDSYEASLISMNWALRYNRKPESEVK